MKMRVFALSLMLTLSPMAFADDAPPTPPSDGPVPSPPGWRCTATGGVINCVPIDNRKEK